MDFFLDSVLGYRLYTAGEPTSSTSMTTILSLAGMSCGHCIRAVEAALAKAGASVVRVTRGEAVIEHDPATPLPRTVVGAIEDAGYRVTGTAESSPLRS